MFSIGGGMASMPLIQNQVVDLHHWLTLTEFTDLITIAEMTPGPIAINSATFVGIRIAGVPGALIATFGCILPSCVIVSLLAWFYFKCKELKVIQGVFSGLRPAVVALIASAGLSIFTLAIWGESGFSINPESINYISLAIFVVAVFILRKWKPNPIFVMLGLGIVGGSIYLLI
jgi:chromate transporter